MTLVEFLHPLTGSSMRDFALATLYYEQRYKQTEALTVEKLRAQMKQGRVPQAAKANLADVLAKSAPYVSVTGKEGNSLLWSLTETGQGYVRELLGLPEADVEIEHDVSSLENLIASAASEDIAEYVKESITCLSVGALRAAVVFLWAGATREIQNEVIEFGTKKVNQVLLKRHPKAKTIKRMTDLSYVKESTLLLVTEDLGVFDKNERSILEDALNLRNKCGHPGKYKPGPKKVSSFIEDVVGVVFT